MRSPWINEVIRLSNSAIPHFIDCLSTSAAITLHSCGYNNIERRGEEWEWRWSALEQCIKFNKHDYAGAYQAHSCLQPPLTKHRQPQPSETENTERLWIEIQYVSRRWTGMFCWKKQKTKKKRSAELTRGWCALSPRLIRTSALLLSLHSFTSDTERYACVSRVMWVCPSVCQCFFMLPFDRLDGGWGGNEGSICCRIWVFVNDVLFFSGDPQGTEGMLPDLGGKEGEWWAMAVGGLAFFHGSLQIHSAPHMVWITTAKPYKWIQHGGDLRAPTNVWSLLGAQLTVSHLWEILVSFKWPRLCGVVWNPRSP